MKAFSIKSTKKFLRLNLACSLIVAIVISVVFFFYTLDSFGNEIYSNISSNERVYTRKNVTLFDNSIEQMSTISARFSLLPNSLIYEGSDMDHIKRKYLNESISNFKYTMEYISEIEYIEKNGEKNSSASAELENKYSLGDIGYTNISILEDHRYPHEMYLEFNDPNSLYKYNILMTVSCSTLSDETLEGENNSTDLVISNKGTVLLSSKTSLIGSDVSQAVTDKKGNIRTGFFENSFLGKKSFISISKSDKINAYLVRVTPVSTYEKQLRNIYIRTSLLTACVFVCAALLCCLIAAISYKPVSLILNNFKNYFPNENNYEIFENEVDYINSNIIKTLQSRDNIAEQLQKNTKLMQTAQLSSLQSQINPHFIFNTLDAVKWLSIDMNGISNPIEKCIVKLEQILRASIDMHNNIVTFSDELSLTESYVDLMHLRYKDLFTVKYDIDRSLENYPIIKFIMQPIIENCIKHSFINITCGGEISIVSRREDNNLIIEISDNGCGIAKEKLAEIKQNLNTSDDSASFHVGLYNVNSRIKLLYGDGYGVSIESEQNIGTKCILKLPLE